MKVLSWDVGIKNLAGCLISYNKTNNEKPFTIDWWNIINLFATNKQSKKQFIK